MIRSHTFESSREAYDVAQTCDAIRDGDVLLVPSEGLAAVLVEAWPVAVTPGGDGHGAFHTLASDVSWQETHEGRYEAAAAVAVTLYTAGLLWDRGMTEPLRRMRNLAAELGWAGEIPAQERNNPDN